MQKPFQKHIVDGKPIWFKGDNSVNEDYMPVAPSPLARKMLLTNLVTGEQREIMGARAVARFLNCSRGNVHIVTRSGNPMRHLSGWNIKDIDERPIKVCRRDYVVDKNNLVDKKDIKFIVPTEYTQYRGAIINEFPDHVIYEDGKVYNDRIKKWLCPRVTPDGYATVIFKYNGKKKEIKLHRLVAMCFLEYDPDPNKYAINHIDGNKLNNDVSNLEWVTDKGNIRKSIIMGQNSKVRPVKATNIKTGETRFFVSARNTALMFNVQTNTILGRMNGKNKGLYSEELQDWIFEDTTNEEYLRNSENNPYTFSGV